MKNRTLKVYIAGALESNVSGYVQNINRMITWSEKVRKLGCAVFVPAIDILLGMVAGDWEYEDYFNNSQPWLDCADAVFLVPEWENSKGTKREIERAKQQRIPIFDDVEKLATFIHSREAT